MQVRNETREQVDAATNGAAVGSAQVVSHELAVRRDAEDDPYLLLVLRLAPPPPGLETWSVDDVYAIREEVRARLPDLPLPLVISVTSSSEGEGDEEPGATGLGAGRPRREGGA